MSTFNLLVTILSPYVLWLIESRNCMCMFRSEISALLICHYFSFLECIILYYLRTVLLFYCCLYLMNNREGKYRTFLSIDIYSSSRNLVRMEFSVSVWLRWKKKMLSSGWDFIVLSNQITFCPCVLRDFEMIVTNHCNPKR